MAEPTSNNSKTGEAPREGAVERATGALGTKLLEFVLNTNIDSLRNGSASTESLAVIREIDDVLLTEREGEQNPQAWAEVLKSQFTNTALTTGPLALALRARCGGSDELPSSEDDVEQILIRIATRAYPSLLLPPEPRIAMMPFGGRPSISSAYRDPESKIFQAKVMEDAVFKKAFPDDSESGGPSGMMWVSTGRGGSTQLWLLADQILLAAWEDPLPPLSAYVTEVVEQYRFTRAAYDGKVQTVRARMAFAGVLLPTVGPFNFGDVTLCSATPADLEMAPEPLSGQLGMVDEDGEHTLISYAGDVVAEAEIPYAVRISTEKLGDPPSEIPPDLLALNPLESISSRLRAALLLATERPHRVQVVPSWQSTDDPLSRGPSLVWSQKESFVGLLPTQLTAKEVVDWETWYRLLSAPVSERMQLAISRIVRATAERHDPVDVLIDSVIAWENLFGTNEGEPTLRVAASLTLLLGPDPKHRGDLRRKLTKIYGLRSKVVHGDSLPRQTEMHLCQEALDVAIRALRAILKDRPDLIKMNGAERSLNLILNEGPVA